MGRYERYTAAPIRDVMRLAEEVMTTRIPLQRTAGDAHSLTLSGVDGTLTIDAHRHGLETLVVATTDQLRTSRIDNEAQYFLNELPYQPGNTPHQPGDARR